MIKEYKSIIKNYFANFYGLGVTILNQIVMIPLFISFWGVEKYGNWILITSFSSFFAMSNLGLNQATNNQFVIYYQSDKLKECNSLLVNSFFLITLLSLFIIALGVLFGYLYGFKNLFGVNVFDDFETNFIFIILLINVFAKMFSGIYNGVLRILHKAHFNLIIENTIKLVETIILIIGLFFKLDIVYILIFYNLPVLFSIIYKHWYSLKHFKFSLNPKNFELKLLKEILPQSLSFMLLPFSQALTNQGMILLLNSFLGPIAIVLYSTTKTLVNFIRTIVDLLSNSIYPEISIAWGKNNLNLIYKIFNITLKISMFTVVSILLFFWFFGEKIFLYWTKNAIEFNDLFFKGMLLVTVVVTVSKTFSLLLLSTNNHNRFTLVFLISQICIFVFTFLCLKFTDPNIIIVPLITFFIELLLVFFTIKEVNRIFKFNIKSIIN